MGSVLSCFPMLLMFLLFIFMILKIGKRSKTSDRSLNLPPGPWKLPIIGNLHQLVGTQLHRALANLAKEYGPFMYLQAGELRIYVVSSPEIAKEVLKTHDINFAARAQTVTAKAMTYNSSGMVFTPYGDYWRQLRKIIVMEVLTTKRVQSFQSIREKEMSNLINWLASKSGTVINLTEKLVLLAYTLTSKIAFGDTCEDQEKMISIVRGVAKVIAGTTIVDVFPSLKFLSSMNGMKSRVEKMHQQADKIISDVIDEHKKLRARLKTGKKEEDEDLVDVLLNVQEHGNLEFPITTDSVKALLTEMFGGGGDSIGTTLDWMFSEMLKNPRILKKAQAEVREVFNNNGKIEEMQYLKLVIKETLRLHMPSPILFPRECRESCRIRGYDIPAEAKVIVNSWAMGRDPKIWNEPESFIPERFLDSSIDYKGGNFQFLPFGSGRRICPGIAYAMANLEVPLAMLLYHFNWKLPSGMKSENLDMTEGYGMTVRRKDNLFVIPTPYHPPFGEQA